MAAPTLSKEPRAKRRCALVLGLDGFRPDCVTEAMAPTLWSIMQQQQHAPSKDAVSQAAVAAAPSGSSPCAYSLRSQVGDICWSGPGWTSACTGVWRDKHGVSGNLFHTQQFARYPTLFQRLRTAVPEAVTLCAVNWAPLAQHVLLPATASAIHEDDDASIVTQAQKWLREESRIDLLFVHLDLVDHQGHAFDYGPLIPEYVDACKVTDARVGEIIATLRGERPGVEEEEWMVLITTDHGGIDFTHEDGRPENRTNFLIVQGADVRPGEIVPAPLVVDVAPTVLAHLGVKVQSAWHLDGRPVGLQLTGPDGRAESFMDLNASQDPLNLFPILPEELEAGPSPEAEDADFIAAEAAKLNQAQHLAEHLAQVSIEVAGPAPAPANAVSGPPFALELTHPAAITGAPPASAAAAPPADTDRSDLSTLLASVRSLASSFHPSLTLTHVDAHASHATTGRDVRGAVLHLLELLVLLPADMSVRESHEITQALQRSVESQPGVLRAFINVGVRQSESEQQQPQAG